MSVVHQLMFRKRITQTAMALQLGMTQLALSRKLRGGVSWSARDLVSAAAAFGVSVSVLVGEPDERPRQDSNLQPTD